MRALEAAACAALLAAPAEALARLELPDVEPPEPLELSGMAFPPFDRIFGPEPEPLDRLLTAGETPAPAPERSCDELLRDAPASRSARAVLGLDCGQPRGRACLTRAVADGREEVRVGAAMALARSARADCAAAARGLLAADGHWWVRYAAAEGLARRPGEQAVLALAQALRGDRRWSVRMVAAKSLGELGGTEAFSALTRALDDPDEGVRTAAAMSLGRLGGPEAASALRSALAHERDPLQRQVFYDSFRRAVVREP